MSAKPKPSQKERNECCRTHLQDAIRAIRKADSYWDITTDGAFLIRRLEVLKAAVKREMREAHGGRR